MKILLLEDEIMLNESICEYLESDGHQVESFFDGLEAFKAIKENSYDLLILDITVPGIDGLTFLEEIHALKIHVPVIYISALVDIEDISRAYTLGCNDYLKKPFHLKELSLRVDRVNVFNNAPRIHLRLSKNYSYDQEHSTLLFNQEPQILTKRQSQIIDLLSRNRGRVVDFEQFQTYVWSEQIVDNATIRAEINRLKKFLKEDVIINVRGMGYMIDKP
ncbi:MAG: regulator [Sulfurimonas sp. RIFOXYD12_FULL_33_39]|uniref:response regulator transcription factor n=1 Tax=unclassified Sulfurimonas TaxID=2623549 RepID=UPI0008D2B49F|nr:MULTISPECIES: response regulator transcription factor [unclassified Sulfurimonas]OHE03134.1 MAG: regulator [Sulfurimonas sp. RIFCSPLOWO2_12_FULL_34_6]OHE09152.1 MAG: regulator [Sulfurimonas sp. RIFOXYD12_FULL_33_39]OHE14469.1 MAG: regulator [Sulfurimonas sp. RIFOXYD2_FULL_34_21]DAB28638.1 MAG TPA: DNA-binding response regulator [Sulfurimonas sp. UBA10385]